MKKIFLLLGFSIMMGSCASMSGFQDIDTARLPFDLAHGDVVQVRIESNYFHRTMTYIYQDGSMVVFSISRNKIYRGWHVSIR